MYLYDGKALAAHGDVIVVTFNYRLGSFGFLSTGDGRIKGNFGMKDQVMALQWVKDNIASFGGDPDRVTIFGQSAGAASVGYHMLSDLSKDLFQRAILQSGSPLASWAFLTTDQAKIGSKSLFSAVNCTQNDTNLLLKCLRAVPGQIINYAQWEESKFLFTPWLPTVDNDFVKDAPDKLFKKGSFQQKDVLMGDNKDEGFFFLFDLKQLDLPNKRLMTYTNYQNAVDIIDWDLDNEKRQQVKEKYAATDINDQEANRDQVAKVCGDRSFTCPVRKLIDIYAGAGSRTYSYRLSYRAFNEPWPLWMGVIHGSDVQVCFSIHTTYYKPIQVVCQALYQYLAI